MDQSVLFLSLQQLPVLKALTSDELNRLAQNTIYKKFSKNSLLYQVGETCSYVYLIEKGSVKLGALAASGKMLTKEIIYDKEIFGENVFSTHPLTREYAETMTETKVFMIPVDIFKSIVMENSVFAAEIMNIILAKLQNIEERLQSFVFRRAKERIVDFIYRTGLRKGIKIGFKECLIDHGMSHKEIAFLTDTSRQTVARIMNELKRENYIHYGSRKSSKILIRDMVLLKEFNMAV
ncbi:MAG: Crp/Fnr family transcriptional regulator [Saprospiraceae bacterium]|nr:MAG: Crp/Fnr family transcriptional regulator [Bacteroidetes bacterium OLB9]MCO6463979.1 Crp/Fnr family transcriptional regulator [Saprospiraceae bacterium]MCZ2339446.1 Crp/Fnr family transcriptional regulator [Chitinophagales bacterium]